MLIKVKATAGAKEEKIEKISEDGFKIKVKEKPEKGLANERIRKIIARYFHVPLYWVILKRGAKRRSKIFEIRKDLP